MRRDNITNQSDLKLCIRYRMRLMLCKSDREMIVGLGRAEYDRSNKTFALQLCFNLFPSLGGSGILTGAPLLIDVA